MKRRDLTRFVSPARAAAVLCATCAILFSSPVWSADSAEIESLNKQALEAFDSLNFRQGAGGGVLSEFRPDLSNHSAANSDDKGAFLERPSFVL